ncbi:hypothetical protein HQ535_11635 [bacterium]|nr:hypothetical protein [bacterium]
MATDRELIEQFMLRLRTAVDRGTGTSMDAEEVKTVGTMLYALSAAMTGGAFARTACGVCGGAEHPTLHVDPWGRHDYEPALLVPLPQAGA